MHACNDDIQIRWSAAVYIRQKIVAHWDKLKNAQKQFQDSLLEVVCRDPEYVLITTAPLLTISVLILILLSPLPKTPLSQISFARQIRWL
jgi:hypothetical protein